MYMVTLLQGIAGILGFLLIAWGLSEQRRRVDVAGTGLLILTQFALAFLLLRVKAVQDICLSLAQGINCLKEATAAGTAFVFGYVGGAPVPFAVLPGQSTFVFGLQALPMVMVVSSLSMLLFHWRILPVVVQGAAWLLQRGLQVGGALGVCAAAKVVLGMSEAPLLIRPYLSKLSRSELFTVMTLGMATTSAAVMVIYASLLQDMVSHPIRHVLTAAIISLPAAVAISRLMVPVQAPATAGNVVVPYQFGGFMQAIGKGASDGMQLFLNILAMLLVVLALVHLLNMALAGITIAHVPMSLQRLFGWLLSPIAWMMGVEGRDVMACGRLLGTKLALNEVIAFADLAKLAPELSEKSRLMMTYALCGFANLGSVGIQISSLGTMAPERQQEISTMSLKAMLAGTLTNCLSATVVGLLVATA